MPKYVIPVTYMMYGKYEIEADTLVEALDEVFGNEAIKPLPPDADYLIDSMNVTEEDLTENNTLSEDELSDVSEYLAEMYRAMND